MWIETMIKGRFTIKNGDTMVSFDAQREDGRDLAVPEWLVKKSLGDDAQAGLAVRIQVEGQRVTRIERAGSASPGRRASRSPASPPQAASRSSTGAGSPVTRLPYGFVPVNLSYSVTDTPVWHDGSDAGELVSGEILCTLEALTPLLPGNARYPIRKNGKENGDVLVDPATLRAWGFEDLKPAKQIAEPLRLLDGRVIIAGSALKGMIRHSLGALLSAPMERVTERHYTYRPNLDFNKRNLAERYVVRPALVIAIKNGGWTVDVFDDARAAIFVRGNAEDIIRKAAQNKVITGLISGVRLEGKRIAKAHGERADLNHRVATYKGGIDGQGLLAGTFTPPTRTYRLALVPKTKQCTLEIPAELYQHYLTGQKEVLADTTSGHLTAHPQHGLDVKEVAEAIERNSKLEIDQLIYVELTTDPKGQVSGNSKIVSFGHHFRYRWAYTSSVRMKNGQPRPSLTPSACERVPAVRQGETDVVPEQLTGARLLFGYVHDDKTNLIGRGVYERLAGRIAINHALSVGVPTFLGDTEGYCVPLPILGQPKSSAWEFYLRQEPGKAPATYGDLPGDDGGELRGRKFYRHQPAVKKLDDISVKDPETIQSDQATLARYICAPNTTFKFAIRFSRLRLWELGALLVTLQPHRIMKEGKLENYAHKLGLGRPLGMGSIRIHIDAIRVRDDGGQGLNHHELENGLESELERKAKQALLQRLFFNDSVKEHIRHWIDLHRYWDAGKLDYPRGNDGKIFTWHTDLRREYSKLRRQKDPDWNDLYSKIMEVEPQVTPEK